MPLDANKLLERLADTNRDAGENVDVTFTFSGDNFDCLVPLAEEIGNLFADNLNVEYDSVVIGYEEHPKLSDAEGRRGEGSPQFTLTFVGPLTADQFTLLHGLAAKLATQHVIRYLGVKAWFG